MAGGRRSHVAGQKDDRTLVSNTSPRLAAVSKNPAVLELVEGPGAPRTIALPAASAVIGRDPAVEIHVDAPSLSRRHCRLMKVGEGYLFVDLDSVNGVHLNGVKVHSAVLREGDRLHLGDVSFIFHERG
jgi:pSer/pThr/pTyr-binding forkhead associated (FHA) protein